MPLKCRGDFIQEEYELTVYIVGDLTGLHSNSDDAEGLQALYDFSEGVGGDLASAREGHGGRASRATEPIQVIEHAITAVLDLINEHLLVFAYQILQVEAHNDEDLISPEAPQECALLRIVKLIESSEDMLVVDSYQWFGVIPSIGCLVLLSGDFECSFGHLKTAADISRVRRDLAGYQANSTFIKDALEIFHWKEGTSDATPDNHGNLLTVVRLVDKTVVTYTR